MWGADKGWLATECKGENKAGKGKMLWGISGQTKKEIVGEEKVRCLLQILVDPLLANIYFLSVCAW